MTLSIQAKMSRIGLDLPRSGYAHNMREAMKIQKRLNFPVIIRAVDDRHREDVLGVLVAWALTVGLSIAAFALEVPPFPYDPKKSRQLLADSGYPNGIDLELWSSTNPIYVRIAETLQRSLLPDVLPDVAVAGERARGALFLRHQKIFSIRWGRSAWIPATSSSMRSKV